VTTRRDILIGGSALLATGLVGLPARAAPSRWGESDYAKAVVIDAQGSTGGGQRMTPEVIAAIRASGMTALSMTVGRTGSGPGQFHDSVAEVARVTQMCLDHPHLLLLVRTSADLAEAKRSGRLGMICNFQDSSPLEGDLAHVALFRGMGVRMIQLTYNKRNLAGDGAIETANAGLSDYGRRLIAEIEVQKLLLDLSHGGARTIAEGVAAATRPMRIIHTGCRALADLPRNVDDATLRAVAAKGGVVGLYLMPFLRASGQPHAEDLLRHIEHAIQICGEDHVGIGTDGSITVTPVNAAAYEAQRQFYEGRKARGIAAPGEAPDVLNIVPEYSTPRRFFDIGRDLAARGHPPRRIDKILGGNFARLFGEAWPAN
jgi:membrane dipeptidase